MSHLRISDSLEIRTQIALLEPPIFLEEGPLNTEDQARGHWGAELLTAKGRCRQTALATLSASEIRKVDLFKAGKRVGQQDAYVKSHALTTLSLQVFFADSA